VDGLGRRRRGFRHFDLGLRITHEVFRR
jgi:hypothetical protein